MQSSTPSEGGESEADDSSAITAAVRHSMNMGGGDRSGESMHAIPVIAEELTLHDSTESGIEVREVRGTTCYSSDNVAPVNVSSGCLGVEDVNRYLVLEPSASPEALKLVGKEEDFDFPDPSPLTSVGGDASAVSVDEFSVCNGFEDALIVSTVSLSDCLLMDNNGDSPILGERTDASTSFKENILEENQSLHLETEESRSVRCEGFTGENCEGFCNGFEDALIVSTVSLDDCHLMDNSGDSPIPGERTDVSTSFKENFLEENRSLHLESEESRSVRCEGFTGENCEGFCNGFEDALIISTVSLDDCHLMDNSGDSPIPGERMDASTSFKENLLEENRSLHLESEESRSVRCEGFTGEKCEDFCNEFEDALIVSTVSLADCHLMDNNGDSPITGERIDASTGFKETILEENRSLHLETVESRSVRCEGLTGEKCEDFCNGLEDALIVSTVSLDDCHLMDNNGDSPIPGERTDLEENQSLHLETEESRSVRCEGFTGEKCEDLAAIVTCSIKLLGLTDGSAVDDRLPILRTCMKIEECEVDASRTSPVEVVGIEEHPSLILERVEIGSVLCSTDEVAPSSALEGSIILQATHDTSLVDNHPSKLSLASDLHGCNNDVVKESSSLIASRRSNPKRAASSRSQIDKKPDPTRIRKCTRNSRKLSDTRKPFLLGMSGSRVSRKRSNSGIRKSTAWGVVAYLAKVFEQKEEPERCDFVAIKIQVGGLKKGRRFSGKRKQQEGRKVKPLRGSKGKNFDQGSPSSTVQTSINESLDTLGHQSRLATVNSSEETCHDRAKLLQHDGLHSDKDLESTLTQDTLVENVRSERLDISHRPGTEIVDDVQLLDPETSPDSVVYHPAIDAGTITSECDTPDRDNYMVQSVPVPELVGQDVSQADTLSYVETFVTQASTSPRCIQRQPIPKKEQKGKKNGLSRSHPLLESGISFYTDITKTCKLPRSAKPGLSKDSSSYPNSERCQIQSNHGQKGGKVQKSEGRSKIKDENGTLSTCNETSAGMSVPLGTTNKIGLTRTIESNGKTYMESNVTFTGGSSSFMAPVSDGVAVRGLYNDFEGKSLKPRAAWVLCDDCHKWRCIPAELADIINETNCNWTCKENTDKKYADCSIPQEKTNSEINAELEISDASGDENSIRAQSGFKGIEPAKPEDSLSTSWTTIRCNMFLHRNRKSQTIDEIMVCHCKPPLDGRLGCGDECLNRLLNIECHKGTCPCGDLCFNQQFQKRKYAKFKANQCGKKGYGLHLQEHVSRGQFLIEYVGEVLDFVAYEARQRYYASRGQKHFYFMALNGGEVIDACAKGNLGRYINHSCNPNCRTEKWMINGEVCIGLFAIRDIKKGEEVTFDYNYVRVFGAAAKKCVCGSFECRGYIGTDPLDTEIIIQGDSDDEYHEPLLVTENGEKDLAMKEIFSDIVDVKADNPEQICIPMEGMSTKGTHTSSELEILFKPESDNQQLEKSNMSSIKTEEFLCKPESDNQQSENIGLNSTKTEVTMSILQTKEIVCKAESDVKPSKVCPRTSFAVRESLSDSVPYKTNISKPTKPSRLSGKPKKDRPSLKSMVPHKARKTPIHTGNFYGVEGDLNELLDENGGLKKRKDAAKGYLKLLLVTASEGDNVRGFAPQSTRDLSLILDALLKTKSRMVLADIINKNGLQLLHNMMKQNRSNFNRIPIIRKLLKVLEFLALKEILTPEHMDRGPLCSGKESFQDSMSILTRHNDIQVQQIARSFRDKWMPRYIRRVEPPSEMEDVQSSKFYHDKGKAIVSSPCKAENHQQIPLTDSDPTNGSRARKRKSRWDPPSESTNLDPQSAWIFRDPALEPGTKFLRAHSPQKTGTHREETGSCDETATTMNSVDEAPPGFGSSARNIRSETVVVEGDIPVGCVQKRFLPQLGVSYGMPDVILQQLGTREPSGGSCAPPQWTIAPGMPFHPFPPLPPYPRENPNPETSERRSSDCNVMTQKSKLETESGNRNSRGVERERWHSRGHAEFYRPQRWNNQRCHRGRPWMRGGNNFGFRGGVRNGGVRRENVGFNFHQQQGRH